MAKESIIIDESPSSSSRPTTLLLRSNPPYFYNNWILNNRLRIENEKFSQRQQSSCSWAFYSLCISVSTAILIIVIYRFTDQCAFVVNSNELLTICFRHWLFIGAGVLSGLSFCVFLLNICRYFRSERVNFIYENGRQPVFGSSNGIFPTGRTCHYPSAPMLFGNGSSNQSFRYRDDEHSSLTLHSCPINYSSHQKLSPLIYDELSDVSQTPIRISISPPLPSEHSTRYSRTSLATINSNRR